MRSHIVNTIFRKELLEVLRDKRMLYLVILLPFFLYPILFTLIGSVSASQIDKLSNTKITVVVNEDATSTPVYDLLRADSSLQIETRDFKPTDLDTLKKTIGLTVPENFLENIDAGTTAGVTMYVDKSQDVLRMRARQIEEYLASYGQQVLATRLDSAQLTQAYIHPVKTDQIDISPEESSGRVFASFLPMMILMFIFLGCMNVGIDITAGEKERRTLQTLFTTTAEHHEIVAGKFLAVVSVGIVSAIMNILSLVIAMNIQAYLMGGETSTLQLGMSNTAWAWFVILTVLATLFLGALCLAVYLLANTFKEAQSYNGPIMMLVIIPAVLAGMPGMELSTETALIPMFNITLGMVDLLKGTIDTGLLTIVAVSSLIYGVIALWLTSLIFNNENLITGEQFDWKSLLPGKRA